MHKPRETSQRQDPLKHSAQYVKGVGPARYQLLASVGIKTVRDLLYYFPRRHQDRGQVKEVADLKPGETAAVVAQVISCHLKKIGYQRSVLTVGATDHSGALELVWFNQPYYQGKFNQGGKFLFSGRVSERFDRLQMTAPYFERVSEAEERDRPGDPIVPIYPLREDLTQTVLRRVMKAALEGYAKHLREVFPPELMKARRLPRIARAMQDMHFPPSLQRLKLARRRFVYEELFLLELAMALRRANLKRRESAPPIQVTDKIDAHIRRLFPFQFTEDQDRVAAEISADLAKPHPMSRLLQGDVGSGKTVLAIYALLSAVAAGYQTALMAPTEVLAEQHYRTLGEYLRRARVKLALVRGGDKASERRQVLEQISTGRIDLVVGTHALIQEQVNFHNLAVVVIDEQHKFGVLQRAALKAKGMHPHTLVMTATPIPRTLTLTVFGDLDLSIIRELPPGRKPVRTVAVPEDKRREAFDFIRKQVRQGRQAFIVYPLLSESSHIEVKSATEMAAHLDKDVFPELEVTLLHGQMAASRKEGIMQSFRSGRTHILVATVVVEVGIDVPNANLMVIENAERFGLSQLHQLRGRIGRGRHKSYCFLFADPRTQEAKERIRVMCETSDGFRIAEEDLRLRGPGEFFGTRQHGLPELKIANIIEDYELLKLARKDAFRIVREDPELRLPIHQELRRSVLSQFGRRLDLVGIG